MSGFLGDLSPEQERALKKMKEEVADAHKSHYDDYYYLRWLRAREFDVSKAVIMMRKNLLFRKSIGADTILEDYKPHEVVDKYYPRGYIGPDKEGCPVRYMPFKYLDFRGLAYSVKKSEVSKFLTYLFEHDIKEMKEMSEQTGRYIERHSYILDLESYSFRQATNIDALNMLNESLKLFEANYPERMKTVYFINVPTYFNFILSMSKPFLSENTINKFKIFGKDFKKALLNEIDAEILPKSLGGTRTDADGNPLCESFINYGGMVPVECYVVKNSVKSLKDQDDVLNIKIPRQASRLIEISIKEPNCKVEWIFETSTKDIAVGLYKQIGESKDHLEELLPIEKVFCHLVPESGAFLCEEPGTYFLKFDNSFSWMSAKKVFYKITISTDEENDLKN